MNYWIHQSFFVKSVLFLILVFVLQPALSCDFTFLILLVYKFTMFILVTFVAI